MNEDTGIPLSEDAVHLLAIGAIAVSLYQYNVSPYERARRLEAVFDGQCAEREQLIRWMDSANWATEMPVPTVIEYVRQATLVYYDEAVARLTSGASLEQRAAFVMARLRSEE